MIGLADLCPDGQGSQFLQCPGGLTARLGVIDQQALPTGGDAKPIAAQMKLANARLTYVDSAGVDQR